jgi:hypothetical protein
MRTLNRTQLRRFFGRFCGQLIGLSAAAVLVFAGCSNLVKADRSKIPDDLYHPSDAGAGGAGDDTDAAANPDAGDDGLSAGDAGDDASPADAGDTVEVGTPDALDDAGAPDVSVGDAAADGG